jgi:HTH-type transcriptional regulator/antitoxin HigA
MNFNNQIYGTLLVSTLPRVIDSLEEYNRVEKIFESFLDKGENRSPEEDKLFDLLANLLEDYERRTLPPLPRSSPLNTLKFLMAENDLKQKDVVPFFGSQGIASEVLAGKRAISKTQAKALAERFKVSVELFI